MFESLSPPDVAPGGQVGIRGRKRDARDPGWIESRAGQSCELGYWWSECAAMPVVGTTGAHVRPRDGVRGGW